MRKIASQHRKIACLALCVVVGMMILEGCFEKPVFAENMCGGASTSIMNCEDGEGGIWHIVNLVINIFSIGVGILGVVGVMVAGVQYLTAKDNQEQAKKAKNRLGQIVIGVTLYAVLFAGAQWLLPGGFWNMNSDLQTVGSTDQVKEQEAKREEARKEAESQSAGSGGGSSSSGSSKTSEEKAKDISDWAWKIASGNYSYEKVIEANGYYEIMDKICWSNSTCCGSKYNYRTFCSGFVFNVIKYSGVDTDYPMKMTQDQEEYAKKSSKWKNVTSEVNGKTSKLKRGDVLIDGHHHTLIITEDSHGVLYAAQAAVCQGDGGMPHLSRLSSGGAIDGGLKKYRVFRIK